MPKLQRPKVTGVDAVILHIVDPPGSNRRSAEEARGLLPSRRAIPSDDAGAAAVFRYFQQHIEKALGDDGLRAARFSDLRQMDDEAQATARKVRGALDDLLTDDGRLVAASTTLAQRLHDVMVPVGRISSGDLAVCLCRGSGSWSRFVALLKIDSMEGFPQRVVDPLDIEKRYVTVDLSEDAVEVLPTTRQRLQKAAFVRATGGTGRQLLLVDLQAPGLTGRVAEFFAADFLAAEVLPIGELAQTRLVYSEIIKERNRAREQFDRTSMRSHEQEVADLLSRPAATVDEIAAVFDGESRTRLAQTLRDAVGSDDLTLEPTAGESLTGRHRFKGDDDLSVTASAEGWQRILQEETLVRNDAGPDYWRIVLHTEKWEEVP